MPGVSHQGGSVQYEDTVGVDGDAGVSILAFRNDADAVITTADLSHSRVSVDDVGRLKIGSVIPGVGATNLGKAEDDAHTSGDVGVMALAIRSDTPASTAADGDYEPLQTVGGRLHVTQSDVQKDDTDKLAVSLYGRDAAAGDTSLHVSDEGYLTVGTGNGYTGADGVENIFIGPFDKDGTYRRAFGVYPHSFNGTTWDRQRNNIEATLLASAARTATTNSADQTNYNNNRGLLLFCDVSSITDTPSVTPQLDFKDPISGDYEPVWIATTAITATGEYIYMFGLGGSGSAGEYDEAVNLLIPRTWRLTMTHADADSITYSVAGVLLC